MFEMELVSVNGGHVEVAVGGQGEHVFVATHPSQAGGDVPGPLTAALASIGRVIQVWPRGVGRSIEEKAGSP